MSLDLPFALLPLAYLILQVAALYLMHDRWTLAAAVPAVTLGLALIPFLIGTLVGSSAAMLPLMAGLPMAAIYMVGLWLIYALAGLHRTA